MADHVRPMIARQPVVALDMHGHACHLDSGANASASVDPFMRNIGWAAVSDRSAFRT